MDDLLTVDSLQKVPQQTEVTDTRSARMRCLLTLVVLGFVCNLSGCSLFVMAGKVFYGDPKMMSPLHRGTGIDLVEDEKTVLVIYTVPESVKNEFPSIEFDLTEETIRRLKRREIEVIKPDDVATFIDDNGGYWHDESELAQHFDADLIVHVDLDTFSCTEKSNATLLRGNAEGNLYVYKVKKVDGEKVAREIFVREITSTYPRQTPISVENMSHSAFQKKYVDLMATHIGQMLHDYRASELVQ